MEMGKGGGCERGCNSNNVIVDGKKELQNIKIRLNRL